ncbi:hypothetical protein [Streptomyces sp. NPDC047706]
MPSSWFLTGRNLISVLGACVTLVTESDRTAVCATTAGRVYDL